MKSLDIRSEPAVRLLSEFLDMDAEQGRERANAEHFAHGQSIILLGPSSCQHPLCDISCHVGCSGTHLNCCRLLMASELASREAAPSRHGRPQRSSPLLRLPCSVRIQWAKIFLPLVIQPHCFHEAHVAICAPMQFRRLTTFFFSQNSILTCDPPIATFQLTIITYRWAYSDSGGPFLP